MKIAIYQINMNRDTNHLAFMRLARTTQTQTPTKIDASIYDKVFENDVNCNTLEDIFYMFNMNHPCGHKGRALSVSDVVEVKDAAGVSTFHFCDIIGFKQVDFDTTLTTDIT